MIDRSDIRIEPPPGGWDILEFVDGYKAQIVAGTTEIKEGIEYTKLQLFLFPDLEKRYKVSPEMKMKNGCVEKIYPKSYIYTLNEDDPVRKVRFCLLNFEGQRTHATEWFLGIKQIDENKRLREELERKRIENADIIEENLILKTNIPKYLKTHSAIISEFMPMLMAQFRTDEEKTRKLQEMMGQR